MLLKVFRKTIESLQKSLEEFLKFSLERPSRSGSSKQNIHEVRFITFIESLRLLSFRLLAVRFVFRVENGLRLSLVVRWRDPVGIFGRFFGVL